MADMAAAKTIQKSTLVRLPLRGYVSKSQPAIYLVIVCGLWIYWAT